MQPKSARFIVALAAFVAAAFAPVARALVATDHAESELHARQWIDPRYQRRADIADAGDVENQLSPAVRGAWQRFRTDHGQMWRGRIDVGGGVFRSIAGSGVPFVPGRGNHLSIGDLAPFLGGRNAVDLATVEAISRSFIDRYGAMLGVTNADLQLAPARSGLRGDYLWTLSFDMVVGGRPIAGASVEMRVNNGNLVGFGAVNVPPPGSQIPAAVVDANAARAIASDWVGKFEPTTDTLSEANLLVLVAQTAAAERPFGNGYELAPVWEMNFARRGSAAEFRVRVDARSGEVIEFFDQNRYVARQVVGGVFPDSYMIRGVLQAEEVRPMPFATVTTTGTPVTNAAGQYDWTSGAVSGSLDGPVISIVDNCGATTLADANDGTTDQNLNFGLSAASDCSNPWGGAGNTRAARMQFHHLNIIKYKARKYGVGMPWTSTTDTVANVNINLTCNAFWSPGAGTVNFYRSGGGCGNTGETAGVSLHEFGHGLDSNDGRAPADNGTGETYGDLTATFQTHASCIGSGFLLGSQCTGYGDICTDGCDGVRDIDWAAHAFKYPHKPTDFGAGVNPYNCSAGGGYDGPCAMEGHCESIISSEAVWDFATRDLVTGNQSPPCAQQGGGTLGGGTLTCITDDNGPYSLADGWTVADRLWYMTRDNTSMFYSCAGGGSSTDGCDVTEVFYEFKIADDDDGNLTNGTPHAGYLFSAFNRHNVGCTTGATGPNVNFRACTPPVAPTLTVTPGTTQIVLNWTSSGGGIVYDVWRGDQSCGAGFTKIANDVAALTYTDVDVSSGFRYYYKVTAHPTGNEPCASPASNCAEGEACSISGTITLDPIGTPANNTLALTWNAIAGADGYRVYRGSTASGPWTLIASPAANNYTDTPLSGQMTFYYYVQAYKDLFVDCEINPSNVRSQVPTGPCTIAPSFGGIVSATSANASLCQIDLTWSAGSNVCSGSVGTISYTVRRSTTPGGPYSVIATGVVGTAYSDTTGLVSGTRYYYNVRAIDSNSTAAETNAVERSAKVYGPSTATLFADDFETDTGWTNGPDTATTGAFLRGDPVGTAYQPELDHSAVGVNCRFTAQNPAGAAGTDDVDGGEVVTTSPVFSAAGQGAVELQLWRWFANSLTGGAAADYYFLEVSNGGPWVTLETFNDSQSAAEWTFVRFALEDFVALNSTMRFRVRAADAEGNVIEVALDDVLVRAFSACASCPGLPTVTVTPAGPITNCTGTATLLTANTSGGTGAFTYQWTRDGSPIATATNSTYSANDTGSHVYNCRAYSSDCAPTEFSEDTTPTSIAWQSAPTFSGLATVTDPGSGICTLNLSWSAATSACPGPITYRVYRSTASGFAPGPANRIAIGLSGTSLSDSSALVSGTPYYYVVRAFDASTGQEDTNLVERTGTPTGPPTIGTWTDDAGDTGTAKLVPTPGWAVSLTEGRTGPRVYKIGNYGDNLCVGLTSAPLVLGTGSQLTFWSQYDIENSWDKGEVQVSTNGGTTWTRVSLTYPGASTNTSDNCGLPTGSYFTGKPGLAYASYSASLAAWNGQTIRLRWVLSTDTNTNGLGWWVDDIQITQVSVPGTCTTGSSCPNNPTVDVTPNGPTTLCTGTSQLLTASLGGGTAPFSYQWTRDGIDIPLATSSTYLAADSGSHTYNCKVRGSGCTEDAMDGVATALTWTSLPSFGGVTSAVDSQNATCTVDLTWNAATTACGGPVTYRIYRSTTTPVVINAANRIVAGLPGTSYSDTAGLVNGTNYYYVVRAHDASTDQEDGNTVEDPATPTGLGSGVQTLFSDDFESAANFPTNWTVTTGPGAHTCGPWARANTATQRPSGGSGFYALTDSDACGSGSSTSTIMTSKVIDGTLPGLTSVTLDYDLYYNYWNGDTTTVEVFNGTSWQAVWTDANADVNGHHTWNVTAYALGNANFRVRFNYQLAAFDYWFAVDDVAVTGNVVATCTTGTGPNPKEAGASGSLIATKAAGSSVDISYNVSCGATQHVVYRGNGPIAGSLAWTASTCSLGAGSRANFDPGTPAPGAFTYFVVVGQNSTTQGSFGTDSANAQRPESVGVGSCEVPQALGGSCP